MTCKCGQKAEVQQPNIFGEIEDLCRDCFNSLGHPEVKTEFEDGLFEALNITERKGDTATC
ncbi:hypothetical protein EXIGUO8H_20359 [Exiguobacterium sp. 8H]|uniref:hypothetical protein n=1 Tax=unclassified Exiguobacterium TaxID=2644629 RepID=UPI0012F304CF|nr:MULTISPECIES: hypothetical protein [unclassified Exiguobacterium]VXB52681.1 hypothetical protein EXIGUO8A_11428 [Exiguobacterium sp. 8A]VXB53236.1 hypothetical protein EXIGUO8H_20359 [Exiguobacterium sp. 8H]